MMGPKAVRWACTEGPPEERGDEVATESTNDEDDGGDGDEVSTMEPLYSMTPDHSDPSVAESAAP